MHCKVHVRFGKRVVVMLLLDFHYDHELENIITDLIEQQREVFRKGLKTPPVHVNLGIDSEYDSPGGWLLVNIFFCKFMQILL